MVNIKMVKMNERKSLVIEDIHTLNIFSPVFTHNADIPVKYTCDGENINPPLNIGNIP